MKANLAPTADVGQTDHDGASDESSCVRRVVLAVLLLACFHCGPTPPSTRSRIKLWWSRQLRSGISGVAWFQPSV